MDIHRLICVLGKGVVISWSLATNAPEDYIVLCKLRDKRHAAVMDMLFEACEIPHTSGTDTWYSEGA